ncbi:MAG: type II secretion system F family protein [Verrucomicrobiota bacterium]
MAFIVTPTQLSHRAELYYQLGALTAAGVTLRQSLDTLQQSPASRSFREPLGRLTALLDQGCTFSEALKATTGWVPSFDVALLEAGEQSGRLDACFKLLAEHYRERAQLARNMLSDLAYPLLLFHLAFLLSPIGTLQRLVLRGEFFPFALQKICFFLPFYTVAFLLVFACQGRHGEFWRSRIEIILRPIPILGSARRSLALARLAAALEALINAGVSIIEAWELAAAASGSPALHRTVLAWKPQVEGGRTPAEVLRESRYFPELFANLYHTGEISGKLDDSLLRLHRYYQEEGSRKLKLVARWTPWLVYIVIVGVVAYQIISFWLGYFQNINSLTNF